MRAFPPSPSAEVRLSVDDGALVIGVLDVLVELGVRPTPEVVAVAHRVRERVSSAMADAIGEAPLELGDRLRQLRERIAELQIAVDRERTRTESVQAVAREAAGDAAELRRVAGRTRSLVGDTGAVHLEADDARLVALRESLAALAA